MTNENAIGVLVVSVSLVVAAKAVQTIKRRKENARKERIAQNKAESNLRHMERLASMTTLPSNSLAEFVCTQGAKAL